MIKPKEYSSPVLGDPFMPEPSERVEKLRRNLIGLSGLTLALSIVGIAPSKDGVILGLDISNLTKEGLESLLFILVLYSLISFIWRSGEFFSEIRIRLTGFNYKGADTRGLQPRFVDMKDPPYNSSNLYLYWYSQIENSDRADAEANMQKTLERLITKISTEGRMDDKTLIENLSSIKAQIPKEIKRAECVPNLLQNNTRIQSSLERFEQSFSALQTAYLLRLLVFEVGVPYILAVLAIMSVSDSVMSLVSRGA